MIKIIKSQKHFAGSVESVIPLTFRTDVILSELNAVQKGTKNLTLDLEDIGTFLTECLLLGSFYYKNPNFKAEDTKISIEGGYVGSNHQEDGRTKATHISLRIATVINGRYVEIPPSISICRMRASKGWDEIHTGKNYSAYVRWGDKNGALKIKHLHTCPIVPLSDDKMPLYVNTPYLDVYAKERMAGYIQ